VPAAETVVPVLRDEHKLRVQQEHAAQCLPVGMSPMSPTITMAL
jgi:hypothetical protein